PTRRRHRMLTPLQAAYLRFFPPATDADIAGFLGTTRAVTAPDRPAAVPAARRGAVVRLLPPSDPYLQGRDRELLVPDPAHRKQIWTSLGAPGVVLSGVDVVGVWRPTAKARRLEVAVSP